MIERIVKRNGETEEFSPTKLNRWGEWAADHLGDNVNWSGIVTHTVAVLGKETTSQELQERLIKTCLDEGGWAHKRMAGRLYAAYINKKVYGDKKPTVLELHKKLQTLGYMVALNYSETEYHAIEQFIDHDNDFAASHHELHQVREKYSIKNRVTGEEYETQQFVYMRMAMALAETEESKNVRTRLQIVKDLYEEFSEKRINAPSPNYVNLGTPLRGYASCCVYTTKDDVRSLAIGDHIAYTMTSMSAGIGSHINTRSIGDPVRKGAIRHLGKMNYYRALVGAVKANMQNGRGGAATTYYSAFDPEATDICRLKNPLTTQDKRIAGIDYAMTVNEFFARKAAKNEQVFGFNCYTAPDLWSAFYSNDAERFAELYAQYEANEDFKKVWLDARDILLTALTEAFETGRAYLFWADEANRHTPFKETIYSSNLCTEIMLPTSGYVNMMDLYKEEDCDTGEVAMCSLAAVNVGRLLTPEQYKKTMYYCLYMIDRCIHMSDYPLAHVGYTAKARMSAGVGITGLAEYLARKGLKYTSKEGKEEMHKLAELHMYSAVEASLELSKQFGVAPWMHKTKWVEGWMPIDTYNRNVDAVANPEYQYDWDDLRRRVIDNGGIRNSTLIAHMPTESSSKASGSSNGLYPVRDLELIKTDNNVVTYWSAPENDNIGDQYELAWDIPSKDLIDCYAIFQKFTDQGISADLYRIIIGDDTVSSKEMLTDFFYMTKMGLKSRYYQNSKTSAGKNAEGVEEYAETAAGPVCGIGGCTL